MKKAACIVLTGLLLGLAVAPVLATEKVSDIYDDDSGTGEAIVYVEDDLYLIIYYKDADGSGDYTPGDTVLRVFRSKLLP